MPDPLKKDEQPHYIGHRERLRQRFVEGGADALPDYELMELVLFMALPQGDVKPIAKNLIKKFGGLQGVLNASIDDLITVPGIKEKSAIALKTVQAAAHRLMKRELINRPVLNNWQKLTDYLHATMAHEAREHFRVLFLNKKNELIADEVQGTGTVDHTPAYPREIMKRALELSATAIILVHNHPSGDPTPSQADVHMTKDIIAAAKPFNIVVHDHLIVAKNDITSFKSLGLI